MYQKIALDFGAEQLLLYLGADVYEGRHQWNSQRHCNGDYELHIILAGSCCVNIEHDTHVLQPDTALLIAPGQYHCSHTPYKDFLHFSVSFSMEATAAAKFTALKNRSYHLFQIDRQTQQICREVFLELDSVSLLQPQMLHALLSQLFVRIFRTVQWLVESSAPAAPSSQDWRACVIDDFFEANVSSYGTKELLAKQLHVSMRQLDRILQAQYGMCFRRKLLQARMDYAAWLLRTTDHKISEIQRLTGYASATTFFQAFEAAFSATPKQYRNRNLSVDRSTPVD